MGSSTDLEAIVMKIVSGSVGNLSPFAFILIYGLINVPVRVAGYKP
jgi:hypothetical protein